VKPFQNGFGVPDVKTIIDAGAHHEHGTPTIEPVEEREKHAERNDPLPGSGLTLLVH
jgi:hypothetical protein